ncbi:Peptidase S10, serine carboxypeptidase [Cynara cardunculus var. scolymus]|uniref:Carboxypeptidase n=1 Tax=Cynara cardunculus var. scolymus TaxID=59895 RepID=A0A103XUV3_CYNCS|nr:Peptidase S10, serine carboxypeptidase [Cynara cardunculus var. scolymus]
MEDKKNNGDVRNPIVPLPVSKMGTEALIGVGKSRQIYNEQQMKEVLMMKMALVHVIRQIRYMLLKSKNPSVEAELTSQLGHVDSRGAKEGAYLYDGFGLYFTDEVLEDGSTNKQTQALSLLYKAKWAGNSAIDTSHFEPPRHLNKTSLVLPQEGLKKKDKIDRLPGQPFVKFNQYGGYVTVNESAGRAFYYYFVEAESSKQSLPLLLWLNGGPGCSSLAYGAMQELGPFRSPAGVGFSYSNSSSDYQNCGDASTAADNYVFLLNWLERFPEYKGREFYISGESYAGHYVPQLAHTILHYNKIAKKTLINLKGILIGNAVINDYTDSIGMYDYLGSHAILSDDTIDQIRKYCDFSSNATTQSDECNQANNDANRDLEHINLQGTIHPCSGYYTYAYMNREDVQKALNANVTKLDHEWELCSGDTDARVAGFAQVYQGDLTFSTILGAGHQVPSYKPKTAFALVRHFLTGKPLNDSRH